MTSNEAAKATNPDSAEAIARPTATPPVTPPRRPVEDDMPRPARTPPRNPARLLAGGARLATLVGPTR